MQDYSRRFSDGETKLWALLSLLGFAACGPATDQNEASDRAAGSAGQSYAGSSSAAPRGPAEVAGGAGSGPDVAAGGSSVRAGAGNPSSGDACAMPGACVACLCEQCTSQVKRCEATPGCLAIADCVATTRCSGLECYCGRADELSCAAGKGDGPCRDAIVGAPGARTPTLLDQSAGPATDAAIALGNCGAAANTGCTASCQ